MTLNAGPSLRHADHVRRRRQLALDAGQPVLAARGRSSTTSRPAGPLKFFANYARYYEQRAAGHGGPRVPAAAAAIRPTRAARSRAMPAGAIRHARGAAHGLRATTRNVASRTETAQPEPPLRVRADGREQRAGGPGPQAAVLRRVRGGRRVRGARRRPPRRHLHARAT